MIQSAIRCFGDRPLLYWSAAILAGGLIHLALWPFSEPPWIFSDFFKAYWAAGEHLWNGGLNAGYPFTIPGNWSNLPVLGWPFALLVPFGRDMAGWIYLGVGVAVTFAAWALLARISGLRGPLAAALLFLFFLNGPLLNSLREGNSTHFILLFLILGLMLWEAKRDYAAGLFFGMCATIKLPLLLLGVYFLARRRWTIVAGGATTIGAAIFLSLAIFGLAANVAWYGEAIGANLGKAMPAFNVQSIDGFILRLSTGATELLYWGALDLSPAHKIIRNLILVAFLGGFAWLMLRAERRALISRERGELSPHDLLQFSIVLLFSLLISPLTWTHYYAYLLIPLGLYLGGRLPLPDDTSTRWLFWVGYALTSLPVIMPTMELEPNPPPGFWGELAARTIVSVWLFGALLLLVCFARGVWLAVRSESRLEAHEDSTPASGQTSSA